MDNQIILKFFMNHINTCTCNILNPWLNANGFYLNHLTKIRNFYLKILLNKD